MNDEEKEEMETDAVMKTLAKNKLYDIFIKTCPNPMSKYKTYQKKPGAVPGVLVTPGKRKISSLPDLGNPKPTKTACRRQTRQRKKAVSGNIKGQQLMTKWCNKS